MEGQCTPIQLQPFLHQVGGHASMMSFNENTICKPLIEQEHVFYKTAPREMEKFIPTYRGLIEAMFHKQINGSTTLVAYPPAALSKDSRNKKRSSSSDSQLETELMDDVYSNHDDLSSDIEYGSANRNFDESSNSSDGISFGSQQHPSIFGKDHNVLYADENPWSKQCHNSRLARLMVDSNDMNAEQFILLENLACCYNMPCILDLKMGTRQHGDDATPEKRRSHMRKCESTTSAALGFRLCGMQVYQSNTSDFLCHNKYYGRKLSTSSVAHTLAQFMHNGFRLRTELIQSIIIQLEDLSKSLSKVVGYRFYSSSLLIMYEGNTSIKDPGAPRIRMIDFAHTTSTGHTGVDKGYLMGIRNLVKIFMQIRDSS